MSQGGGDEHTVYASQMPAVDSLHDHRDEMDERVISRAGTFINDIAELPPSAAITAEDIGMTVENTCRERKREPN